MNFHDALVEQAKNRIRMVHDDGTVPYETTKESLKDLREEIGILIEGIELDIKRRDAEETHERQD
jgi:hypothetical protein